ncbi:MAG: hypothetical protein K6T63_00155 [Alicyclobacillus herbarius]|uniref:hypothetical protein n=1 Tax=Alicyclobacillus herbarius TaxID=122960 RepID=UPI000411EA2D|nr:hypothetical protein [Alicyclobacillus herbarius]MCL6631017.1 hypothetical protein [Alicyclobacillus herbarius]
MYFRYDDRLQIELPHFPVPFASLPPEVQEEVLVTWEKIRARIPERILDLEQRIEHVLQQVHHEEDWNTIAGYFQQISDYASRITELNTWRRVDPSLSTYAHEETHLATEHRDREK